MEMWVSLLVIVARGSWFMMFTARMLHMGLLENGVTREKSS